MSTEATTTSQVTEIARDQDLLQWMTFALGDETYGLDVMGIKEVLRFTEIAPVPGAPHYVLGIINLRGNVVTVFDARARFGLPSREVDDNTRIVVIETQAETVGILVDAVSEVVYLRSTEIEDAPNVGNEEMTQFIRGVCNKNEQLIILINLNTLVSTDY